MKRTLLCLSIIISVASCNNGDSSATDTNDAKTSGPTTIKDTSVQHPNGITSDGVISTDTAAFGVNANRDSTKK
jgi:hypothetical protein